jgi:hypothetical protein
MKLLTIFFAFTLMVFASCEKNNDNTATSNGDITVDIGTNNLKFKFSKFTTPVDSINLAFESKEMYNCNLYRINALTNTTNSNTDITLYGIYYASGFCVYGNYPATFTQPIKPLKEGKYKLKVKKADRTYEGEITVKNKVYTINWQYDDIMTIDEKQFTL